ncbi:hypothetical protein ACFQ7F_42565, partial [Streptomyces sp. NPDC056486]|uniref:hypothetical protein n=1 Tax=Streptomyces sp. NPDC056486 TaxID=3345835 RepID=UPI00368F02ED
THLSPCEGEAADWSVGDYLLAHVVDQLADANWMFATVNQDEDADPLDPPEPLPRPGADVSLDVSAPQDQLPTPPNPTPGELAAFFA